MKNNYEVLDRIKDLIEEKNLKEIKRIISELSEVDAAEILNELPKDVDLIVVFRLLNKEVSAEIFVNLDSDMQEYIINSMTDKEIGGIVEEMFTDDAVDVLEEMPATVVKRVLRVAKPETRKVINQFLNYPETSAGGVMTSEFVDVRSEMTRKQAVARLRQDADMVENVYLCFVTDSKRVLEGVVTIKDLLLANDEDLIKDIMDTHYHCAHTLDDQEQVAMDFAKYDLVSLPVLDEENRLVGIITVDDIVDVIQEEATEDILKMNAVAPTEEPYLKLSVWSIAKSRIVWLLILMLSSMISGLILEGFEEAISIVPLLVVFMPMLMDTGGNSGSQAATTIIRGLAINEIRPKDILKVVWKEVRVAILCGLVLCSFVALRVLIQYPSKNYPDGGWKLIVVLTISLMVTVTCAKLLGAVLPIIAKKLKLDPAIMAAPMITTLVDATALLIYFSLAKMMYNI